MQYLTQAVRWAEYTFLQLVGYVNVIQQVTEFVHIFSLSLCLNKFVTVTKSSAVEI